MIRIEFPKLVAWFQTPQTVSRPSRPSSQTNSGTRRPIEMDDEVENTIDLKFEIKLEWFDHRHTYNNLKEKRSFLNALNKTDLDRIWLPLVVYQNTDQFETTRLGWINEWSTRVKIIRKGNFER